MFWPKREMPSPPQLPGFLYQSSPSHLLIRELPPLPLHENQAPVEATPILSDALNTKATAPFFCVDGKQFMTLRDLGDALLVMSETTFDHHVSQDRNDFANWGEACFTGESQSIGSQFHGKTRKDLLKLLVSHDTSNHDMPLEETMAEPVAPMMEPLPPSPLQLHNEQKINAILQQIQNVFILAQKDHSEAREEFIRVRNIAWRDLDDKERQHVIQLLREAYDALK